MFRRRTREVLKDSAGMVLKRTCLICQLSKGVIRGTRRMKKEIDSE